MAHSLGGKHKPLSFYSQFPLWEKCEHEDHNMKQDQQNYVAGGVPFSSLLKTKECKPQCVHGQALTNIHHACLGTF